MAGFVLKSHHYPTGPVAELLTRVYPGLTVVGAVALNDEVGGLNVGTPWRPPRRRAGA